MNLQQTLSFLAMLCSLALAGISCGSSGDDCASACGKIYDQCKLVINVEAKELSKDECLNQCSKDPNKGAVIGCVMKAPCLATAIEPCLQGGVSDCSSACSTIYQNCSLKLTDKQGNDLSEADCVTICSEAVNKAAIPGCIANAQCNADTIVGCFQ